MAMGHWGTTALTAQRPTIAPRHLGRGSRFVDEHQAFGFQIGLGLEPSLPALHNVRPLLLACVRGFF